MFGYKKKYYEALERADCFKMVCEIFDKQLSEQDALIEKQKSSIEELEKIIFNLNCQLCDYSYRLEELNNKMPCKEP